MDNEQDTFTITQEMWDEITERMEGGDYTFNVSTGGTATTATDAEGMRVVTGIDWGNSAASAAVFGASRTTWDAGYVYAPYNPLMGDTTGGLEPQRTEYFTFQPRMAANYINFTYKIEPDGRWKMYTKPEDHFIEHEDLFEI